MREYRQYFNQCKCGWMDGWMDGWIDGWMDFNSQSLFGTQQHNVNGRKNKSNRNQDTEKK